MPLIGLILLAAAVVVAVELVLANKAPMTVHLWKWDWNIHTWGMAAWGAAILFVAFLGWWMIWRGSKRRLRKRRERRALAAENEELAERVEAEADDRRGMTGRNVEDRPPWGTATSSTERTTAPTTQRTAEPTTAYPAGSTTERAAEPRPAADTPTSAYPRPAGDPYQTGTPTTAYPGHPQLADPPPEQPPR